MNCPTERIQIFAVSVSRWAIGSIFLYGRNGRRVDKAGIASDFYAAVMREILDVWRKPRLLVLASYTAAVYAAVLIPFKYGLPLVPGATEIRPGVAVLLLCGLLFGPAAAWGGAFGNLIGDFFGGTLGVGSIFGFVGNFLLAYLPWRAWEIMRGGSPAPKARWRWWLKYMVASLLGAGACAAFIAWGLDLAVRLPFFVLGDIIFFNNALMFLVLAPLLLGLLVPRMQAWGFTYRQLEPEKSRPGPLSVAGLALTIFSTALLMAGGNLLSHPGWMEAAAEWFSLPGWVSKYPPAALFPLIVVLLAGTVLMALGGEKAPAQEAISDEKKVYATPVRGVRAERLRFRYAASERYALNGVDLEAGEGELVVIMGKTGAGKTTLARCITGAAPHFYPGEFSGSVAVGDCRPSGSGPAENAHCVGMVFEDFESQLFSTNATLELAFGPENLGMNPRRIRRMVDSSFEVVGLGDFKERDPASLSGGEKQRLATAAVLAMNPPVIILDEPTTDLDPVGKQELFGVMRKLRERGKTVILIEHEASAAEMADRVMIMEGGSIVENGPPVRMLQKAELLEDAGVRPPDSARLFGALFDEQAPMPDVESAAARLAERGWKLNEDRYLGVVKKETARAAKYGDEILRVENLEHTYPAGSRALRGVSLGIKRGEFVALLGHNGSGKTTLAKHLNGLLKPTYGRVYLEGEPVSGRPLNSVARRVGYVFQNPDHQIFSATVRDEVSFAPTNFGFSEAEVEGRVADALEATGLTGYEDLDPFHLTRGERQRVAVAGVLAGAPDVIVLDEPTTGLDLKEQRSIMELLRRLNEEGHTIIIITHTVWVAAEYAHRTVLMSAGSVLADDSTRVVMGLEEPLEKARVRPPQITEIGLRAFGKVFLSVEEMVECLEAGRS